MGLRKQKGGCLPDWWHDIRLSALIRYSLGDLPLYYIPQEIHVVNDDTDVFVWIPLVSLVGHVPTEYPCITAGVR